MTEKFESKKIEQKEKPYTSKVSMRFYRHAEKELRQDKEDIEVELTEAGKKQAVAKAKEAKEKQILAFSSPRKRAKETAGFIMSGKSEKITGKESLAELEEKVSKQLKVGKKIGTEKRLDFDVADWRSNYGDAVWEAMQNEELLKFLVERSDKLAEKFNDKESITYSRAASAITEIILRYLKIAPRWDALSRDPDKKFTDTLERVFGSHQGVLESFLAKLIEQTRGKEERDKFVQVLDNNGFDFTEGFKVEILNREKQEPVIHVSYKKEKNGKQEFEFDEDISLKTLENIIQ